MYMVQNDYGMRLSTLSQLIGNLLWIIRETDLSKFLCETSLLGQSLTLTASWITWIIFTLLCAVSKGFMKAFKVFIKSFEAPQKKCENNLFSLFTSRNIVKNLEHYSTSGFPATWNNKIVILSLVKKKLHPPTNIYLSTIETLEKDVKYVQS